MRKRLDSMCAVTTASCYCIVYIDFAKAFDTKGFTQKVIRSATCLWSARPSIIVDTKLFTGTHQTKIGPYLSDTTTLISGVIQGSGVGPLMFLVYINELATVLEKYGI